MNALLHFKLLKSRLNIVYNKNIAFTITLGIQSLSSIIMLIIAKCNPITLSITLGQLLAAVILGSLAGISISKVIVDLFVSIAMNKENVYQASVINKAIDVLSDSQLSDEEKSVKITEILYEKNDN